MTRPELIRALRRMKAETGSLVCLGCGHEHNCDIQGCAIIRAAAEELEKIYPLTTQHFVSRKLFDDMKELGQRADESLREQTRAELGRWVAQHVDIERSYDPDSDRFLYWGTLEIVRTVEEGDRDG